jgi:nitroimidazol reductase NimA-like FMN-containing flavoprotein (pyridoxamine 5'-phosphate oxidase superfamily)
MRRKDREISDIKEIETIIAGCDACRVAFASANIPYIVTMNFGYAGGKAPLLYFHCAPLGKKIEMIATNNYVCFEMDTDHAIFKGEKGCDWGMNFSSVVGYGNIFIIKDETEKIEGLSHIMNQYSGSGTYSFEEKVLARTTVLRLEITEMTAKRK